VVRRGDTPRALVALTFDAGSDCGNAGTILQILADNGITATFALTGEWAEGCPTVAARIGTDGHVVMNHSYDHPSFTGLSTGKPHLTKREMIDQITRAETAITAATGRSPEPWFRPPFGEQDAAVNAALAEVGYVYDVLWTVDSLGWKGVKPSQVVTKVLANVGNGTIVLMHVGSASTDAAALQAVIDGIRDLGFGFATVAEIVG
jgi:peptidoglycan/xylan/chitin deacetylase (PgdA/CDA1 family)